MQNHVSYLNERKKILICKALNINLLIGYVVLNASFFRYKTAVLLYKASYWDMAPQILGNIEFLKGITSPCLSLEFSRPLGYVGKRSMPHVYIRCKVRSPVWRHVAPTHLKSLQVIQSKCLRSATGAPWYVSNLQIHSDLGVPYLAEHIRSIAQSLYSTFPDAENPLVRQLGRYLAYSRHVWKHVKTCTRIQNSISAFSPDGVSLIVEAFSWHDPNCWAHNPEV